MLWRRRAVLVVCATTVVASASIALRIVPAEYESSAEIIFEDRRQLASKVEDVMGGMQGRMSSYLENQRRMTELAGRVQSRVFLERIVQAGGLDRTPEILEEVAHSIEEFPDTSAEELAKRLVIERLKKRVGVRRSGSGMYTILVADSDPDRAYFLAKTISEQFVSYSIENSLAEVAAAREFGAEQMKLYEQRLEAAELALGQYQQISIGHDMQQGMIRALTKPAAEALQSQVAAELELSRLRLLPIARSVSDAALTGESELLRADSEVHGNALELLGSLEDDVRARLVTDYSRQAAEWPPAGNYMRIRRGLLRVIERRASALFPELNADDHGIMSQFVFATLVRDAHSTIGDLLARSLSAYRRRAELSPHDELELARLESEVESTSYLLESFRAQLVASEISQAMEITSLGLGVKILDPPELPLKPTRPDKAGILLAALILGPVLGVGVAFVTELLDPTLRSMEDFQRVFPGPILGSAPLISKRPRRRAG
jgi:uncharacterized protein involved in exopolysaccharide biosynthesis